MGSGVVQGLDIKMHGMPGTKKRTTQHRSATGVSLLLIKPELPAYPYQTRFLGIFYREKWRRSLGILYVELRKSRGILYLGFPMMCKR